MIDEHVPQAKIQHRWSVSPPASPHQEIDALTPRQENPFIEKYLQKLVKKGLFGRAYVKDCEWTCNRGPLVAK